MVNELSASAFQELDLFELKPRERALDGATWAYEFEPMGPANNILL